MFKLKYKNDEIIIKISFIYLIRKYKVKKYMILSKFKLN